VVGGTIQANPGAVTGLRGRDVAEKLSVTIDSRGGDTVVIAFRLSLPSLWDMDISATVSGAGFCKALSQYGEIP
jgi:hypothetical protein